MRLIFRPSSLDDFRAVHRFIATDNATQARNFVMRIRQRCGALREHPLLGPARPDLGTGLRIIPMRPGVVVVYRVASESVEVLRVFYGGQDYEAILRREGEE
jgi:toxin ParE1/3/4